MVLSRCFNKTIRSFSQLQRVKLYDTRLENHKRGNPYFAKWAHRTSVGITRLMYYHRTVSKNTGSSRIKSEDFHSQKYFNVQPGTKLSNWPDVQCLATIPKTDSIEHGLATKNNPCKQPTKRTFKCTSWTKCTAESQRLKRQVHLSTQPCTQGPS